MMEKSGNRISILWNFDGYFLCLCVRELCECWYLNLSYLQKIDFYKKSSTKYSFFYWLFAKLFRTVMKLNSLRLRHFCRFWLSPWHQSKISLENEAIIWQLSNISLLNMAVCVCLVCYQTFVIFHMELTLQSKTFLIYFFR